MKCSKCSTKNIIKASYCKTCGNKFTKKEQEYAYSKTFFGRYDLYKKWKSRFSLEFITDSIFFKIAIIVLILGFSIYYWYINGINTKLLESDYYDIYYNDSLDEYYIIVNEEITKVGLNLYLPNRLDDLIINHYSVDDELINEIDYVEDKDIILETYNNDYYIISSIYSDKETESLKIFVYNNDKVSIKNND